MAVGDQARQPNFLSFSGLNFAFYDTGVVGAMIQKFNKFSKSSAAAAVLARDQLDKFTNEVHLNALPYNIRESKHGIYSDANAEGRLLFGVEPIEDTTEE